MKVRTRADRARDKCDKIIREITQFTGERPKVIRVNSRDLLALTECGHVVDDKLRNTTPAVKVMLG